jgi:hypothetical protein
MSKLKNIKLKELFAFLYLFYALYIFSHSANWFELTKALVVLAIAIVTLYAVIEVGEL